MSFESNLIAKPTVKSPAELATMRQNTRLLTRLFQELHPFMVPGTTGLRIQEFCRSFLERHGMQALLRGYRGFPAELCVSVNEVAVHGLPDLRILGEGDVVSIDIAGRKDRWCADAAWTWLIGERTTAGLALLAAAWKSSLAGVKAGGQRRRISAIGGAIQETCQSLGYAVLPRFGGHGIGRQIHEAPVFAFVESSGGADRLSDGWVVNIEPVVCQKASEVAQAADGWSWYCPSGARSAQYEFSLALLPDGGYELLNFPDSDWLSLELPPFF